MWSDHQEATNINRAGMLTTSSVGNLLFQSVLAANCRHIMVVVVVIGKATENTSGAWKKTTTLPFRGGINTGMSAGKSNNRLVSAIAK